MTAIDTPLEPDEGFDPKEMTPLVWETMKGDWDDPRMDDYDHHPERQSWRGAMANEVNTGAEDIP